MRDYSVITPIILGVCFVGFIFFIDEIVTSKEQPKHTCEPRKEVIKNFINYAMFVDSLEYGKRSDRVRLADSVSKYSQLIR